MNAGQKENHRKRPDTQDPVKNNFKRKQICTIYQNIKMYKLFDSPNAPCMWMGFNKFVASFNLQNWFLIVL